MSMFFDLLNRMEEIVDLEPEKIDYFSKLDFFQFRVYGEDKDHMTNLQQLFLERLRNDGYTITVMTDEMSRPYVISNGGKESGLLYHPRKMNRSDYALVGRDCNHFAKGTKEYFYGDTYQLVIAIETL